MPPGMEAAKEDVCSGQTRPFPVVILSPSSAPSLWEMPVQRLQVGSGRYVRRCVVSKKEDGEAEWTANSGSKELWKPRAHTETSH